MEEKRDIIKRAIDIALALCCLILLSPLYLTIITLIRLNMGKPIFFLQPRAGKDGQLFTIIKFRTMTDKKDSLGNSLPDAGRLTSLGKFLRSTSLDELPECLNVLRGDMSFVGPRPLLLRYLERYTPEQYRRHAVQPGITGWAQVNGRNALTWEEKFTLDVWYVDHRSFWLDMKILAMTTWKILSREGINQQGHATMEEFTGNWRKN